jgi:Ser-tRNA(Ala) deacylase AlaX
VQLAAWIKTGFSYIGLAGWAGNAEAGREIKETEQLGSIRIKMTERDITLN